jgi:hypothetical protein
MMLGESLEPRSRKIVPTPLHPLIQVAAEDQTIQLRDQEIIRISEPLVEATRFQKVVVPRDPLEELVWESF